LSLHYPEISNEIAGYNAKEQEKLFFAALFKWHALLCKVLGTDAMNHG